MKPILFNTEMVRAILERKKTTTRRLIRPRYREDESGFQICINKATGERWAEKVNEDNCGVFEDGSTRQINPPYCVGEILYVRETWMNVNTEENPEYFYLADDDLPAGVLEKWKPSIHMPKKAARIFLRVTYVRIQPLQDIDDDGVMAEGLEIGDDFDELWDSTIKPKDIKKYGWRANPWVGVIEFEWSE